jgi:transcriptional regulator with XRE-family HTH domain
MKKPTVPSRSRPLGKPGHTRKRKPDSTDTQVGESIRARRPIAGRSQNDLAKQLGVSFQQVQKGEKGANRVGAGRLPRTAELLNNPISALFAGDAVAAPARGKRSAAPAGFITDPSALRLWLAYLDIEDRSMRRCLCELVELMAGSAKPKRHRGR